MNIRVKITTLGKFMDWLCPYKCRGCGKIGEALCGCCIFYITAGRKVGRGDLFVGGARDGLLARVIAEYKYKSVRGLARPLAEIVSRAIPEGFGCAAKCQFGCAAERQGGVAVGGGVVARREVERDEVGRRDEVVVVPLPTISKHIRARGFDHTWLLAKNLAEMRGWRVERVLARRNVTVQVGADAETRVRQANEAYEAVRQLEADLTYLLVDDVTTTGASLAAAEKVMREAGAKRVFKAVVAKNNSEEGEVGGSQVGDVVSD